MKGRVFLSGQKAPAPTLLLLHGWPGSADDVLGLGALLSREGMTAVTFNPRGMHGSEGTASFAHALEDIGAALEWLRAPEVSKKFGVDTSRIVLAGHSWGGGLGLAYAARDKSVRRIVSIAPNDHGEFVREYRRNAARAAAIDKMVAETTGPAGPVRFDPKANGIAELSSHMDVYGLRENASRLADRDILIVGGWEDEAATVEQYLLPFYRALKRAGAAHVTFLVYHDGHNFVGVRERLASDIREWVLRSRRLRARASARPRLLTPVPVNGQ
jgi:pimeloyl-ACP methyl ester carboxylesterase